MAKKLLDRDEGAEEGSGSVLITNCVKVRNVRNAQGVSFLCVLKLFQQDYLRGLDLI